MPLQINNAPVAYAPVRDFLETNCAHCPLSPDTRLPLRPQSSCELAKALTWALSWGCAIAPDFRALLHPCSEIPPECMLSDPPPVCPLFPLSFPLPLHPLFTNSGAPPE